VYIGIRLNYFSYRLNRLIYIYIYTHTYIHISQMNKDISTKVD